MSEDPTMLLLKKIQQLEHELRNTVVEGLEANRRLRSLELKMYLIVCGVAGGVILLFVEAATRG